MVRLSHSTRWKSGSIAWLKIDGTLITIAARMVSVASTDTRRAVKALDAVFEAAQQQAQAQHKEQVAQDRADDGGAHQFD